MAAGDPPSGLPLRIAIPTTPGSNSAISVAPLESPSRDDPGPFYVPDASSDTHSLAGAVRAFNAQAGTPRTNPPFDELVIPHGELPQLSFIELFETNLAIEGIGRELREILWAKNWSSEEFTELEAAYNFPALHENGRKHALFVLARQASHKGCAEILNEILPEFTSEEFEMIYEDLTDTHDKLADSLDLFDLHRRDRR